SGPAFICSSSSLTSAIFWAYSSPPFTLVAASRTPLIVAAESGSGAMHRCISSCLRCSSGRAGSSSMVAVLGAFFLADIAAPLNRRDSTVRLPLDGGGECGDDMEAALQQLAVAQAEQGADVLAAGAEAEDVAQL